jgi:hypothetical protein
MCQLRRIRTKLFTDTFAPPSLTGLMSEKSDERLFMRVAGTAAILSGAAWLAWAVLNGLTHGGMELMPPAGNARLVNIGELLTAAWNLLLIPCALAIWRWLEAKRPSLMLLYTVSGVFSLAFWGYGGATHGITPALETCYLFMSAVWWTGTGLVLWQESRGAGLLTIVLGMFTGLDCVMTLFEPLPDWVFAISAPKLPLAALWSVSIGVLLLKRSMMPQGAVD